MSTNIVGKRAHEASKTTKKSKHVVFLINSLAGGGAERVMVSISSQFVADEVYGQISLVLLDRAEIKYQPDPSLDVHILNAGGGLIKSLWKGYWLLRELTPDVCVSFLTRSNIINVMCSLLLGYEAIISERAYTSGHRGTGRPKYITNALVRRLYPLAAHVIAVSEKIKFDLARNYGVSESQISTIYNPIDHVKIDQCSKEPTDLVVGGPYFVAMGRLIESKNFATMIQGFAFSCSNSKLVILGDGPLKPTLMAIATKAGVAHRIIFGGFQTNPFSVIAHARAFLLTSNAEGFPNSLLEAMSLGVPVVATNCNSGPSEILDDVREIDVNGVYRAKYGLLIPTNSAKYLAEAINMLEDEHLRESYAELSRLRGQSYTLKRAACLYQETIDRCP